MTEQQGQTESLLSVPDKAPTQRMDGALKTRGMAKLAGMDLEELRRVADARAGVRTAARARGPGRGA